MKTTHWIPPLAERMRPQNFEEFYGQKHLLACGKPLFQLLQQKKWVSLILWGPPGTGKTTFVHLIAKYLEKKLFTLNAVQSGIKELREVIEQAPFYQQPILFIDEIHRFNKSQQDALLNAVEKGIIIFIGATTENPSFEVISALRSRCHTYVFQPLTIEEIQNILIQATQKDEFLKQKKFIFNSFEAIYAFSGGDARKALNVLELVYQSSSENEIVINDEKVKEFIQENIGLYDKDGENHYDTISAFIKSIRGSDPNAAVFWLAKMLVNGEDPLFIARRMIILASEDIGNANPNALLLANACYDAVHKIGMPEARIILSQTATYLAASLKSNAAYLAIDKAMDYVKKYPHQSVPLHLRNAPTTLMKNLQYGFGYKYSHDFDMFDDAGNQDFLPNGLEKSIFYQPKNIGKESEILQFLKKKWKNYYSYE
jgi:putative ATPase